MTVAAKIREDILFKKITTQSKAIIDEIEKRRSKNLDKIKNWVNQIKPEFLPDVDLPLLVIIVDTIHLYFQNESNQKEESLIENCLCNIIDSLGYRSNDEILVKLAYLKAYIKTGNADTKSHLKNDMPELGFTSYFSLFAEIHGEKLAKLIAVIFSRNVDSASKYESIPLAESTPEPYVEFSECKSISKIDCFKKKIIPSLIYFDKKGKGHRVKLLSKNKNKPKSLLESENLNLNEFIDERQRYENNLQQVKNFAEKEFKRLAKIEISDETGKLNKNLKAQLSLEAKEIELFERLESINKTRSRKKEAKILNVKKSEHLRKIKFWSPALASIEKGINLIKVQYSKFEDQDIIANIDANLLSMEGYKNKQLINDFINYIDYGKLKALIKLSKETSNSLENTCQILNQINNVRENLGFHKKYINYFQQDPETFAKLFSNDFILNYLQTSFSIYSSIKFNLSEFIQFPVYELNKISEDITPKLPTVLTILLTIDEIIFKQRQAIKIYLEKNYKNETLYRQKILARSLCNNNNKLKNLLKKIKHFLINFFKLQFYFIDQNFFSDFMHKLNDFIENQKQPNLTIDLVRKFIATMSWKTLIFYGINPLHLYKTDFKKCLEQLLFLSLINQNFQNVIKTYTKNIDINVKKNISDKLFCLIEELGFFQLDNNPFNYKNNLIETVESRDKVLNKLEVDEEMKDLLRKMSMLKARVDFCRGELTRLCNFVDSAYQSLKKLNDKEINLEIALPFKNTFFKYPSIDNVDSALFNQEFYSQCI